jgi:hypothetical protein
MRREKNCKKLDIQKLYSTQKIAYIVEQIFFNISIYYMGNPKL